MIIYIKLGIAFYNQGFFNVLKKDKPYFGKHQEKIKVKLGCNGQIAKYPSHINRKFNENETLSTYIGNEYTNWVQTKFRQGDAMKIEIVNPNSIILYAKGEEN
ncbi:MAG: hypothetical protein REI64_17195 [Pedobacter sp.]|uniref:hypothetical protein n=1 Tax=Pedobacter sp. TaxID=1411316 RepID=UPI0028067429|nr:hypothetical protein [Pedobacter sp.]MDQ8006542.1 hypothetical protein [Pedobacter sp.]